MRVLLTGGAGYIGSHTYVALVAAGFEVVIVDDFSNSFPDVISRLAWLTGEEVDHLRADIRDESAMEALFAASSFDAVIHFAGRKSVPDSVQDPQGFFEANTTILLSLLRVMERHGVHRLVYSSSAAVYGQPSQLPITEDAPLAYTSPYGLSKVLGEQFVQQKLRSAPHWCASILRYFNPAGAHPSGLLGEAPRHAGGNLMPVLAEVALGQRPCFEICGNDFNTIDGTGLRDFIHVCDLAQGHVRSLQRLLWRRDSHVVNLGRGQGVTVRQVLDTYAAVCERPIPCRLVSARAGDVAASVADTRLAGEVLGFEAKRDLQLMCQSSWEWALRQYRMSETPKGRTSAA